MFTALEKSRSATKGSISPRGSAPEARALDTRRFYDDNASAYASLAGDAGLEPYVKAFTAALPPHARVVDLGSGAGRELSTFRVAGVDICGLDFSIELARIAQRNSGASVVVSDMTTMPFASGAFDGVWASASLLHLDRPGMIATLAECYRVLRSGGLLFTSMKRGHGERRELCGRWFSYVQPEAWRECLRAARFDILEFGGNDEARRDGVVTWVACLAKRD